MNAARGVRERRDQLRALLGATGAVELRDPLVVARGRKGLPDNI
jgi:hypothetical protein